MDNLKNFKDLLVNGVLDERLYAVWILSNYLDREDVVDFLLSQLNNSIWRVRKAIADLILEKKVPGLYPKIKKLLESNDDDYVYWAMFIASQISYDKEKFLNLILEFVKHENSQFRMYAAINLGRTGEEKVIPVLINMLSDKEWRIRKAAADSIERFGKVAIPYLNKTFNNAKNEDLRFWTIKLLGKLAGESALKVFKAIAKSSNFLLRRWAVIALGEINSKEAVETLIEMLSDEKWHIRAEAALKLIELGNDLVVECLKERLENIDKVALYWVLQILAEIEKENSLDLLQKYAESKDHEIRSYVINALSYINNSKSVDLLMNFFADSVWVLRKQAAEIILRMVGFIDIRKLIARIKSNNEDEKYWSIYVLVRLPGGMKKIFEQAEKLDKKGKIFLLRAVSEIDDETVVPYIVKFLGDDDWIIRKEAASILIKKKQMVLHYVIPLVVDEDENYRFWSCNIVYRLKDYIEIDEYITQFGENKVSVLLTALIDPNEFFKLADRVFSGNDEYKKNLIVDSMYPEVGREFVEALLNKMNLLSDFNLFMWYSKILERVSCSWIIVLIEYYNKITNRDLKSVLINTASTIKRIDSIEFLFKILEKDSDDTIFFEVIKALIKNFKNRYIWERIVEIYLSEDYNRKVTILNLIKSKADDELIEIAFNKILSLEKEEDKNALMKLIAENVRGKEGKIKKLLKDEKLKNYVVKILSYLKGNLQL